mgnify:CR=1 FL=1
MQILPIVENFAASFLFTFDNQPSFHNTAHLWTKAFGKNMFSQLRLEPLFLARWRRLLVWMSLSLQCHQVLLIVLTSQRHISLMTSNRPLLQFPVGGYIELCFAFYKTLGFVVIGSSTLCIVFLFSIPNRAFGVVDFCSLHSSFLIL